MFIIQVYTSSTPFHSRTSNNVDLIGDPLYTKGVNHWANSSAEVAKCVVEPGTAADIGVIVGAPFFPHYLQTGS